MREALGVTRYYDRQGFPLPGMALDPWEESATKKWAELSQNQEYVRVAWDELPDGSYLSTVWLGLDHGWSGRPLFFETMRFGHEYEHEILALDGTTTHMKARETLDFPDIFGEPGAMTSQDRYGSEEEALAAHHEIVRRLRIQEGH